MARITIITFNIALLLATFAAALAMAEDTAIGSLTNLRDDKTVSYFVNQPPTDAPVIDWPARSRQTSFDDDDEEADEYENADTSPVDAQQRFVRTYLSCNDQCNGIKRSHIIPAIHEFCKGVDGRIFDDVEPAYDRYITYSGKLGKKEQGVIRLVVQRDTTHTCFDYPIVVGSYAWCASYMRIPVDQCNTRGENGKQGGFYFKDCVQWYFDPNPDKPC